MSNKKILSALQPSGGEVSDGTKTGLLTGASCFCPPSCTNTQYRVAHSMATFPNKASRVMEQLREKPKYQVSWLISITGLKPELLRILTEMVTCPCSTSTSRITAWFSTTRKSSTPLRISLQPSGVWSVSARDWVSSASWSSSTSSLSDGASSFVVRKSACHWW